MPKLNQKKCRPCEDKTSPLSPLQNSELLLELDKWNLIEDKRLEKTLMFKDFASALAFINRVGAIAESEGHHPDLNLYSYNKVKITLSTHNIDGLSENDFILAAKIDELTRE